MLAKKELLYVPLIGWTWYFLEIVFCKRKWEEDRDTVIEGLQRLADYPEYMWVSLSQWGGSGGAAGPRHPSAFHRGWASASLGLPPRLGLAGVEPPWTLCPCPHRHRPSFGQPSLGAESVGRLQ